MKILESRPLVIDGKASVHFIRIDPEDISATLSEIIKVIMDLSWLKHFDPDFLVDSYRNRASKTISDIKRKFDQALDDGLTKDAGEYLVSELEREAIVSQLNYLNIPLAELLGKKVSGNPGFDFHSQNPVTDTIIFGEAKYISGRSAYSSAIEQIKHFVDDKKDIDDIADLEHFCTVKALSRAANGLKGFAAAFSAKNTASEKLIQSITQKAEFKELLVYDEIIIVAVNL